MPSAWLWRRTWGRGSGRSPRQGGRSRATGRSSPTRGAAGRRSSLPWGACCTCRSHQACQRYGLRHPRPQRRSWPRKQRPSRHPRGAPRLSMAPMPTFATWCRTSAVTWPRSSVGQRRSTSAPGLGWMGLVTAHGELASTAGPPTSTPNPAGPHPAGHAADLAQRDQALAMLACFMPGAEAGPFASAQARSRALMLPTVARPAAERGASPSAARSGAIRSAARPGAVTSTGSTAASASGGQAEGEPAASAGSQQTTAASGGGPRGQGPPRQPPAPGADGPPGPPSVQ